MGYQQRLISTDQLVRLGSKREWVPMWLWFWVIFRYKIYEIWPFSRIFYIKYRDRVKPGEFD